MLWASIIKRELFFIRLADVTMFKQASYWFFIDDKGN